LAIGIIGEKGFALSRKEGNAAKNCSEKKKNVSLRMGVREQKGGRNLFSMKKGGKELGKAT